MQTMFDPTRIKKAETLFAELLTLPAPQRERELVLRCTGDPQLVDLLRRLLKHDDSGMGGFLVNPGPQPLPENTRVGNFQLLRRIGEGGMGIVYEARQVHPDRSVALKVIRGGRFVDRNALKLFDREVQALARLRHPGIAAIYEAGRTDDEQHFFAMEFIEGRPLMEYVRSRPLNQRQRLDLFRQICDAIHYAHQRGVMHRDLKPTNILIDADAHPRILDFGLARITDTELGVDVSRTAAGRIQGTLPYMSPEQARGNPDEIDIRSDVYSLGVILYELITDRLPYDVTGRTLLEAVNIICEQAPSRPGGIAKNIPSDLETITRKALEKDPNRRYASASALVEDVERYLTHHPILARPPSALYQCRMLVRRHKMPCAFAAVLLLVIIGFGVWMSVQYEHQRQERLRAERSAAQAQVVIGLLNDMLGAADPENLHERNYTVRELLDDFAAEHWPQLRDEPAVEATLRLTVGNAYLALGEFKKAEEHVRAAIDLRKRVFGAEGPAVAEAIHDLGKITFYQGDYSAAEQWSKSALDMRRRHLGADHLAVAESLLQLGTLFNNTGKYDLAEALHQDALAIRRRQLGETHPDVAECLHGLGVVRQHRGDLPGAAGHYRQALAIRTATLGANHPAAAAVQFDLGSLLQVLGDFDDSENLYRQALATTEERLGKNHPSVAWIRTGLASLLRSRGSLDEAEAICRQILAVQEARLGRDHAAVAALLNILGSVLRDKAEFVEAEAILREAVATNRHRIGPRAPGLAHSLTSLAALQLRLGRLDEADALYAEALDIYQTLYEKPHPHAALAIAGQGELASRRGDLNTAESKFRQALEIQRGASAENHPQTADYSIELARTLAAAGRLEEALPLAREAMRIRSRLLPPGHPKVIEAQAALDEYGK